MVRRFPDPVMMVAAIDRLVHHSTIIEMDGERYRKRSALARTSPTQNPADNCPAQVAEEHFT